MDNNTLAPTTPQPEEGNTSEYTTGQKTTILRKLLKGFIVWLIFSLIFGIVSIFAIFTLLKNYFNSSMPSKDDYINYLIEKYGNDDYSYVHSGNCSSFTSYCERYFTSQKVDGREFSVSYSKINNIGFTDQYWLVKNEPAIDEYFRAKFDIFMPYNYDLTYSGEITDMDESKVTADQLLNSKDFKVEIIIHVNYYNIPDINNIDISSFRHEFLKNVRSTSTPTVSYARLKINMEGSGRTENCPNSMATEHTGDGTEVGACSISL